MCSAMCTLNIAGPYRPMPELVATSSAAHPPSQAMIRPTGHGITAAAQAPDPREVDRRQDERRGAEDQVEPPVEQQPRRRRRGQ